MSYELLAILLTVVGQGLYIAYKMGKFEEKLIDIEKKQEKHNSVVERTFCNERDISVLQEQVKVSNHRIQDIEEIIK